MEEKMKSLLKIVKAEILKQHRNWFHSKFVYFSLLIWPILVFFNAYYTYQPFINENNIISFGVDSNESLIVFLVLGFIGYNCFWSMVKSAWQMGFERIDGTLEYVFLAPANRLAIMYGRALGALLENVWMYAVFSILMLLSSQKIHLGNLYTLPLMFAILIVSATIWGGLMNVLFLFSRDASFLFKLFNEPMLLFSGVRIPIHVFPYWAKIISALFPLTYSLTTIRHLFANDSSDVLMIAVMKLVISLVIIVILTHYLLKFAEKKARKTGALTFY